MPKHKIANEMKEILFYSQYFLILFQQFAFWVQQQRSVVAITFFPITQAGILSAAPVANQQAAILPVVPMLRRYGALHSPRSHHREQPYARPPERKHR